MADFVGGAVQDQGRGELALRIALMIPVGADYSEIAASGGEGAKQCAGGGTNAADAGKFRWFERRWGEPEGVTLQELQGVVSPEYRLVLSGPHSIITPNSDPAVAVAEEI